MEMNFLYCDASTWLGISQPWNVFSNILFVFLSLFVWSSPLARRHRYGLLLIAFGSALWHSTGLHWALWIDIGAIVVWAVLYALDIKDHIPQSRTKIFISLLILLLTSIVFAVILKPLTPMLSGAFIPYALLLLAMAFKSNKHRSVFLISSFAMLTAIVMREIDMIACDTMTMGTHWLWHTLAAVSLIAPTSLSVNLKNDCDK